MSFTVLQVDIVQGVQQYGWVGSLLIPAVLALWFALKAKDKQLEQLNTELLSQAKEAIGIYSRMEKLIELQVGEQGRSEVRLTGVIREEMESLKDIILLQKSHALETLKKGNDHSNPTA